MKKHILIYIFLFSFIAVKLISQEDLNHCLVKYKSEWSKTCIQCDNSEKSYRVYFRNECDDKLDIKCAVQEYDLRWKTFTRLDLNPRDTLVGYSCRGTGKYMYWVRKAGDQRVPFLTDEEINNQYGK